MAIKSPELDVFSKNPHDTSLKAYEEPYDASFWTYEQGIHMYM